ncbi:hypothetical protein D3C71_1338120 [compost metagenome]
MRKVEQPCVQHPIQRQLAELGNFNAGARVQGAQDGHQALALVGRNQVDLVQHDDVAEFDLLDQQINHRALVLIAQGLAALLQTVLRAVVTQEVEGVHHGHHRVQARHFAQAAPIFAFKGESLGHGQRLGNAGGFDDQVIKTPIAGQAVDLYQQVFAQGAADAAVAHLDQLLVGAGERRAAFAHQRGVDVDFGHIVDDHGNAPAFTIVEDVVQQRGLAGAEKAGQDRDGQLVLGRDRCVCFHCASAWGGKGKGYGKGPLQLGRDSNSKRYNITISA